MYVSTLSETLDVKHEKKYSNIFDVSETDVKRGRR